MRFFEKQRPQVFIHTAKLKREKKTGRRLWQFTLIVTMTVEQVESCDVPVAAAWDYITSGGSAAVDVLLASEVDNCTIDFFAEVDDPNPVLHLEGVDLAGLRFTRDKNLVEFWFSGEHENVGGIHDFMKPYAYTRVWAAFTPSQGDLPIKQDAPAVPISSAFIAAVDRMASSVRTGGFDSIELSTPGMEPVVIDKAAAARIHEAAKKARRGKDPG